MDSNLQQQILDELKKLNERVSRLESSPVAPAPNTTPQTKKVSLREFLMELMPTDDVQRTLSIAYYLETQEGYSSFNKADIEKGFRAAKEKVPSNINDKIAMCVKNGHMMEAAEKKESLKAWTITNTGEKVAQAGFRKGNAK